MAPKNKNEVKQQYAILHTKKIRNRTHLTFAVRHNLRLRVQGNIDSSRSELNQILVNDFGIDLKSGPDFQTKMTEHYQKLGIKEKKNNVLCFEYFATASPEFFEGKSVEEIGKWAGDQVKFMRKEFGENLKFAVLHLDERTPHIHFLVTTEKKSIKRYKNRYGECEKETWSLSSASINPEYLADLQTRFCENNRKYGLVRGVEGSLAKHTSNKAYWKMVDKVMASNPKFAKEIEATIKNIEVSLGERFSIDAIKEKVYHSILPKIKGMADERNLYQKLHQFDFQQFQRELIRERREIKKEREAIASERVDIEKKREVYATAINEKVGDAGLVFRLQDQLLRKDEELAIEKRKNAELRSRLRQRFEKFLGIARHFLGALPKPKIS